jgi:thiol reductant ABC exporter CydC subunit
MTTEARAPLRQTLALCRPLRRRIALTVVLGAASIVAGIGLLAAAAWLLSRASQHPSIVYLGVAIVAVRFFAISRALFRYLERLSGHDGAFRLLGRLRVQIYRRLEVLAPGGLAAFRRGDLLARIVGDVDGLQELPVRVVPSFATAILVGIVVTAVGWIMLPAAAVVLGLALLAAGTAVPLLTRYLARWSASQQAARSGELSAHLLDLLEGAAELAANGAVDEQLRRIADADAALTRASRGSAWTSGTGAAAVTSLTGAAVVGTVLVGVPAVHSGRLDGVLLATLVLIPLAAFELVVPLPGAAQALESVRQRAGRVFSVLDAAPNVRDPDPPQTLPAGPYRLSLRNVSSWYRDPEIPVIDAFDLDLSPGRRVALVGRSGAGKSTLANVLLRFAPYAGSVSLNGVELVDLAGDDVRRVIGLVAQDAHVFDTTIRENLAMARRGASDDELRAALARARLLDAVDALPRGLDTYVGEDGARLSGGQRQRLALARAHLAGFSILVLDEPTEHLDPENAFELTTEILTSAEWISVLLITHDVVGLEAMDEIIVLDAGRVIERGTHMELLARGGPYAGLYDDQRPPRLASLEGLAL